MTRLSLRGRLLALTIVLLAVGLGVGGVVASSALDKYLVGRLDSQLRSLADIAALAPGRQLNTDATVPRPVADAATDVVGDPYLAYLAADGRITREVSILRSASAPRPQVPRLGRATVAERAGQAFDVPSRDGDGTWRMIVQTHEAGSVAIAVSREQVDATIQRLRTIFLVVGAGLLLVLSVTGWFAVRGGLHPLRRIEDTAISIANGDMSQRIPDLAAPKTQIGRLSSALNGMPRQLETAFAARERSESKMRRFVADVSHELRTPLFSIKGFAELYLMGGLSEYADVDRTMRRIDAEAGRLAGLTENLLLLARLDNPDSDDPPLRLEPVDLRTLAADATHDLQALDPARDVQLTGPDGGHASPAPIAGDEDRLRQVVANLVGNIIAHTPPGSDVRIGVGTFDGESIFEIAESGPGMAHDEAERAFDRLYRPDSSRTRGSDNGAGLGLAIVRSLVTAHAGRVELRTTPGTGALFRLSFPTPDLSQ